MLPLNLPKFSVKVTEKAGKPSIWDPVRRKFVALTPEEWVRQHFVNYLVTEKNYPQELLANEVAVKLNGTSKRCDTVAYNRFLICDTVIYRQTGTPFVIIEYKAPHIEITSAVFDQIVRYNMVLHVKYLTVSNGIRHFCCKIDYEKQTYAFLEDIPEYNLLEKIV